MDSMIEIECSVSIGLVGCVRRVSVQVDAEEWAEMDDAERDQTCLDYIIEHVVEWDRGE